MRLTGLSCVIALIACGSSSKPEKPGPAAGAQAEAPLAQDRPAEPQPAAPPLLPAVLPEAPAFTSGSPRSHVARALAQVPAGAKFVAGFDVPRLMSAPISAVLRDALFKHSSQVPAECSPLSAVTAGEVVVAGAGTGGQTGDAWVAFFGPGLRETDVVPCAKDVMKSKGGELKTKQVAGLTAYYASGTSDDNGWMTWTKAGAPIFANSEAWLAATLDPKAPKIAPALADLALHVDHARMAWVAAEVSPKLVRDLGLPLGLAAPVAMRASADLTSEIDVDVVLAFKTADEANQFATLVRTYVGQARQTPFRQFVANVRLGMNGTEVRVMVHIDATATAAVGSMLKLN